MNNSDRPFILKENQRHYRLGFKHGLSSGIILAILIGIIIFLGYYLYLASLS